MEMLTKENYITISDESQENVRKLVLAGLEQVLDGKTKDLNSVCDRLEKKCRSVSV